MQVDGDDLAYSDRQPGPYHIGEAGQRRRDAVAPDARRHPEHAAFVGDGFEGDAGCFIHYGDRDARQHAACRIGDRPCNRRVLGGSQDR